MTAVRHYAPDAVPRSLRPGYLAGRALIRARYYPGLPSATVTTYAADGVRLPALERIHENA